MSKLKIHSKKAEVIEFTWKGAGTVPTVEMRWRNRRVKFDCPVAMMFAYQELEKDLEDGIKVTEAQMEMRKELEKQAQKLQKDLGWALDRCIDLLIKYEPEGFKRRIKELNKLLK